MAKKNFTTNLLNEDIAEATSIEEPTVKATKPRRTYTDKEALEAMAAMKTAGLKGVKQKRINMAYTPDNYLYITTMAQVRGESITSFVNHLIEKNREENADLYQKAIEFKNSL